MKRSLICLFTLFFADLIVSSLSSAQATNMLGSTGDVGIGTTSPGAKWEVVGKGSFCQQISVARSRLITLPLLEAFIQPYKLLPEMPTAKEVEEQSNQYR